MSADERARSGLFLAFQYPVELPGVGAMSFLREAVNSRRKFIGQEEFDHLAFVKEARKEHYSDPNFQTLIDNAEEAYAGMYDSDEDFVHDLLEMCGDIPENMPSYIYIDWKKTAECIMQDYVTDNNYYFRYL